MTDLLLTHGTVVTMDAERRVLEDGAVAIAGGRIAAVGPTAQLGREAAARTIDCRARAVIPGLIDAHGHGGHPVIEAVDHADDDLIRAFITPFTIVPSVDPSNPTSPDLATALTEHDRLQARRVREIARRWKTRIHSDAFGGMVRMAIQDREGALL